MKKHYDNKQSTVMNAIKKHYEQYTTNVPDDNGVLNIDVSYDGSWMKRGHTSKFGMGIVTEVCTGYVVDFQIV